MKRYRKNRNPNNQEKLHKSGYKQKLTYKRAIKKYKTNNMGKIDFVKPNVY